MVGTKGSNKLIYCNFFNHFYQISNNAAVMTSHFERSIFIVLYSTQLPTIFILYFYAPFNIYAEILFTFFLIDFVFKSWKLEIWKWKRFSRIFDKNFCHSCCFDLMYLPSKCLLSVQFITFDI